MKTSDFDYTLPEELIAQYPEPVRTASRLLHVDGASGTWNDRLFVDLPQLVRAGDILVFNDTKVIKARLFGRKESGGQVEVLIERVLENRQYALAHIRASKSPRPGTKIVFPDNTVAFMKERAGDLFVLYFENASDVYEVIERIGNIPLPPYISHVPDEADALRYQTIYARHQGSVAAPTAGLHFDLPMLDTLRAKGISLAYVTLHVGAGTFRPVRNDDPATHIMHSERYEIGAETVNAIASAKAQGGRVIAVGTTSLRTLEAASSTGILQAQRGDTQLFITPGYQFKTVDRLITNFHLPKSTLLMLVSAFAGSTTIREAYAHAIAARYRFFSYGDAMLLERGLP